MFDQASLFSYSSVQMNSRSSNSIPCRPLYLHENLGETFFLLAYKDRTTRKIGYVTLIISCENNQLIFAHQFCDYLHASAIIFHSKHFLCFCLKQVELSLCFVFS